MKESIWHDETRSHIVGFLEKKGYLPEPSHIKGKGDQPLYLECRESGKSSIRFSHADIVVPDSRRDRVKYIIEIENECRPKLIIGVIGATYISNCYDKDGLKLPLKKTVLFVVVNPEKAKKEGGKQEQFLNVKEELKQKLSGGSLEDFEICVGLEEFKEKFNEHDTK